MGEGKLGVREVLEVEVGAEVMGEAGSRSGSDGKRGSGSRRNGRKQGMGVEMTREIGSMGGSDGNRGSGGGSDGGRREVGAEMMGERGSRSGSEKKWKAK